MHVRRELRDADRQLLLGGEGRAAEKAAADQHDPYDRCAPEMSPDHCRPLSISSEAATVTRACAAVNPLIRPSWRRRQSPFWVDMRGSWCTGSGHPNKAAIR